MGEANNNNMLDIDLIYEAMKPKPMPPNNDTPGVTTLPLGSSSSNEDGKSDKLLSINLDYENYMMKNRSASTYLNNKSSTVAYHSSPTSSTGQQIVFNYFDVGSASSTVAGDSTTSCSSGNNSVNSGALRPCICGSNNSSISNSNGSDSGSSSVPPFSSSYNSQSLPSCSSYSSAAFQETYNNNCPLGNGHNINHVVSSLLPLVECRACFHNVCAPFSNSKPCEKKLDSFNIPPPTLHSDTVSTF